MKTKPLTMMIHSDEGLYTIRCPEYGVISFGQDKGKTLREIYDMIHHNTSVVLESPSEWLENRISGLKRGDLKKVRITTENVLKHAEKVLSKRGNISSLFDYVYS